LTKNSAVVKHLNSTKGGSLSDDRIVYGHGYDARSG